MIVLDLSILNQKGTPMFNSDLTANRPAAGIVGRIFIAIDSPYGIFRDTGTAWDQISSAGGGATLYSGNGTLSGNRTVSSGGFNLTFAPQTTFFSSLTASTSASSFSVLGSNTLSYAVGFSSSNIGNVYGANGAINAQTFLGNATFAQANLASAMVNVNKIDFGSGGHTITMTQSTAPGIRAMTGVQNQIQFTGSHNGTISHAAISQNLGFFRDTGSTRTLTITNAYSLLINPLDDYGAGFTFTNRWGIYQAGTSDTNYFAGNVGIGTNSPLYALDVRATTGFIAQSFKSQYTAVGYLGGDNTAAWIGTGTDGLVNAILLGTTTNLVAFYSNSNERGRIHNSGNWSIATAVDSGYRFDVAGAIRSSTGGIIFTNTSPTSDAFYTLLSNNIRFYVSAGGNLKSNSIYIIDSNGAPSLNASAISQIDSTTKGFLPPRMTNAQRTTISSPAVGLIVYCTDAVEGLYVNKSTGWTFII